jgi:hypothetical protein
MLCISRAGEHHHRLLVVVRAFIRFVRFAAKVTAARLRSGVVERWTGGPAKMHRV